MVKKKQSHFLYISEIGGAPIICLFQSCRLGDTWNPLMALVVGKRRCFGGLIFKKRSDLGSRYLYFM